MPVKPVIVTLRADNQLRNRLIALAHARWKSVNELCRETLEVEVQRALESGEIVDPEVEREGVNGRVPRI